MRNSTIYEQVVIDSIATAGFAGKIQTAAGNNANAPDADLRICGKTYNVEVKLNRNAQMGGSSIRYFRKNDEINFVESLDHTTQLMLAETVCNKKKEIDQLIQFIADNWDPGVNQFPLTCSKEVWTTAQNKNLLINAKIHKSVEFITAHYAKKNVYYVQIGGAGLFWMQKNPAELPIPQLQGNINIEIRSGRSGSRKRKDGTCIISAGLRIQARLKAKNTSPYTLDDPNSIKALLSCQHQQKLPSQDEQHQGLSPHVLSR